MNQFDKEAIIETIFQSINDEIFQKLKANNNGLLTEDGLEILRKRIFGIEERGELE